MVDLSRFLPFMLPAASALGLCAAYAARLRTRLGWYAAVLLLNAVAVSLFNRHGSSPPFLTDFAIWALATLPAVAASFLVAVACKRLGAPEWATGVGAALAYVVATPLIVVGLLEFTCALTGNCL